MGHDPVLHREESVAVERSQQQRRGALEAWMLAEDAFVRGGVPDEVLSYRQGEIDRLTGPQATMAAGKFVSGPVLLSALDVSDQLVQRLTTAPSRPAGQSALRCTAPVSSEEYGDMGAGGLSSLGWDERAARAVAEVMAPGCAAGRVVRVDLDSVVVATEAGDCRSRARELPAVGDWVVVHVQEDDAVVVGVAPRWSELDRRDPTGRSQVLAANVDLVLVTAPADRLSVARVEREVALGWDSGARPVVLLTKSDLARPGLAEELRSRLAGVEVVPVSTVTGVGAEDVAGMLRPALTAVLLGPSGAGKSSLANLLLGRGAATTGQVRPSDHRGRHVTSSRGLYAIPTGGVIIDTPGLRSLSLTIDRGGVAAAFPDIETLATDCRFGDCRHEHEPDCAVLAAEREGTLDGRRLANYRKLRRELEFELRRDDPSAARENQRIWKERSKAARRLFRDRGY